MFSKFIQQQHPSQVGKEDKNDGNCFDTHRKDVTYQVESSTKKARGVRGERALREKIIEIFSKIHFRYKLHFEALFLAVHIFDHCWNLSEKEECMKVALASIMLSVKYEEIYPPQLREIAQFFKLRPEQKRYAFYEFKMLKKLDYSLDTFYPTLPLFETTGDNPKLRDHCHMLLELIMLNPEPFKPYTWQTIASTLQYMFTRPPNRDEFLLRLPESLQLAIKPCASAILHERSFLGGNKWLMKKYYSKSLDTTELWFQFNNLQ